MKPLIILLLLACCPVCAFGQEEKMQTDRPGETLSPHLTKKGFFQLEGGFEKEQQSKADYRITHPEFQLKYGLSNRLELRAEVFAESEKTYSTNGFKYGLNPIELGFKAKLLEENGVIPQTSFYTQIGIPKFVSEDHQTSNATSRIKLLFENQFLKKFHLNYNVGTEWDGENPKPRWMYSIDQEIELSKKWEVFIETFAYFQQGEAAQHHIDGGLSYFPTSHVKFDVYAGKGLSPQAPEYFISAGFSFRLK